MVYLLLFIAVVIAGAAVFVGVGESRKRPADAGAIRAAGVIEGLVEPVATLPPVLLPERPLGADVRAVRFSLGLRGYRMDQVDEVLDVMAAELERLQQVIRNGAQSHVISATDDSSE
ncbi:DivIVA domain-containing protein [Paeniglutamicibacter cryotolerans]|uniref:DivIVA domain-containing protein n=1 Tax=Paeniglutamicibacter cryotolerans TaxID=670079 RepID=A0A839QTB1_9MICC|nr:DivIVA domain-containing protein [Paeniglutamicibacter cryotolerans]MBB2996512.1 DivIVA domain-containing protein [Paeniglutamicibacter cryotolerans]